MLFFSFCFLDKGHVTKIKPNQIFPSPLNFFCLNTQCLFKKTLTATWSAVAELFWAPSKSTAGLVNTSRPKPQTSYEENNDWIISDSIVSCKCRVWCQKTTVFSSTYAKDRQRQAIVTLKTHNSGLDRLGAAHFWPLATLVWVSTHTSRNTGLD